ncbi:hypothetical protein B0J13DRAFT_571689 [Dactylonectria estremocensis]|uniref:Uncharacterized protein n=1 Tax=Dactylonectria estremocensis TaxID=1079267 RepID=A0A9P9IE58_9HYPO|nr:hypothetical protein B0J13DRAFT_571689 [Dactylonectria estremocensis]
MAPLGLLVAAILPAVLCSPLPPADSHSPGSSIIRRGLSWSNATCSIKEITDASYNPDVRWASVDSENAWSAVATSWNKNALGTGQSILPFPMMVSNFFHGPEHMNCQDVGDGTCNTMIQCHDTSLPAGYLILNSFVAIHQVHQNRWHGLDAGMNQMQNSMARFTDTFAPQLTDGSRVIREILTSFAFIAGLGSAYSWNTVIKASKIFSNDDWRGVAKDAFNSAIAFSISTARDHLPTATDLQSDLMESMGHFVGKWMDAEADYVKKIFSGSVDTLPTLHGLLQNGMQGAVPVGTDLATLKDESQKIVYTKMIPAAWKVAPAGFSPFILVSDNSCTDTAQGDLAGHIDDSVAAKTHVCYDNKIFYLVTPQYTNNKGYVMSWKLNALPGGTSDSLKQWGGVSVDDLVISSWDGYKLNGYKNGYQMPPDSKAIDGNGNTGNIIFEAGVRTPGFSSLAICDVATMLTNLANCNKGYEGFPCRKLKYINRCDLA